MEELKKTLKEAINVLRRTLPKGNEESAGVFRILNTGYNKALDDVIEQVINKIPN
jgi:hypothetical protein